MVNVLYSSVNLEPDQFMQASIIILVGPQLQYCLHTCEFEKSKASDIWEV